ncbi:MAG TPA: pyridoxamine 5'-phosphate oxidase family protein [Blastocatellia bacterium]|nr:pyridoxamine 5'-phosphate oxidase family protein [Blastocatellia bacterium]
MKRLTRTLKQFSEQQELLRLAYLDQSSRPRVVPVWFVTTANTHYIGTGASSPKWKAMQRDPRVAWVIDGGKKGKYKGSSMFGKAEAVTDKKLRARLYRLFGEKYFGSADHPRHVEIWGEVDDPGSVYIRLKVEDAFSWEY